MKDRILDLPMTVAVGVVLCSPVSVFREQGGFTFVILGYTSTHLPGGKVDNTDASINAAAIREVSEECGIDLDEDQLRTIEFWHQGRYNDKIKEVSRPFVIVYVAATLTKYQWEGLVNAEPDKHKELMKVMHTEGLGLTYHDNKAVELAKAQYLEKVLPKRNPDLCNLSQKEIEAFNTQVTATIENEARDKLALIPVMREPEEIQNYIVSQLEKEIPITIKQVQGLRLNLIERAIEFKTIDILRLQLKNGLVGFVVDPMILFENKTDDGKMRLLGQFTIHYTLELEPGMRSYHKFTHTVEHLYSVEE